MTTQHTPESMADHLRHLVADAIAKMNDEEEERDRQYILEDLVTHLLAAATVLDGNYAEANLEDNGRVRLAYPLAPRESFGPLTGFPSALDGGKCPYTHSHTRAWCGFPTCRES